MKEITRELVESIFGKEEVVRERLAKALHSLEEIERDEKSLVSCLTSHNSILAIGFEGKPYHVVDTNEEGNTKQIFRLDHNLAVQRWTPETAQAWLEEDTQINTLSKSTPEKFILSEKELRALVKEETLSHISSCETALEMFGKIGQKVA